MDQDKRMMELDPETMEKVSGGKSDNPLVSNANQPNGNNVSGGLDDKYITVSDINTTNLFAKANEVMQKQ